MERKRISLKKNKRWFQVHHFIIFLPSASSLVSSPVFECFRHLRLSLQTRSLRAGESGQICSWWSVLWTPCSVCLGRISGFSTQCACLRLLRIPRAREVKGRSQFWEILPTFAPLGFVIGFGQNRTIPIESCFILAAAGSPAHRSLTLLCLVD